MKYHNFCLFLFSILIFFIQAINPAFADARIAKFRLGKKPYQYIAAGGLYTSDYNSKEYKTSLGYQYKGERFINEIDFLHHSRYVENSTLGAVVKNRELYDGELSSKVLIGKSTNYFNYYNRSKYDKLSEYYYDYTNSVGWGRILFDGLLEADINIGYNEIKNFESQIVLNPNLKFSLDLTSRIKLIVKAYLFQVEDSYYEELKTRISYKLTDDLSLELYHNYDKKRYFYENTKVEENRTEVRRDFVFRIRYDF
jgi:hypothetical protein